MGQVFDEEGKVFPVTLIKAGPVTVTQIKNAEKDGYGAVQFGFDEIPLDRADKPQKGKLVKVLGPTAKGFRTFKEWRIKNGKKVPDVKVGDKIDVSSLAEGELVNVVAISKGKGFASVIKRHGFKGQPRSHGQKHSEHAPGSIGGGLRNKVPKGMRMAGRMGSDTVTIKNLKIVKIDKDSNTLLLKGSIPGRKGTLVEIYN